MGRSSVVILVLPALGVALPGGGNSVRRFTVMLVLGVGRSSGGRERPGRRARHPAAVRGVIVAGPLIAFWGTRLLTPVISRLGLEGRLAADNTRRNPKRTATTANALLIGVFLVTRVSRLPVLGWNAPCAGTNGVQRRRE